jgi:hypothetical protein
MMCDAGHIFCALRCLYRCALMYLMRNTYGDGYQDAMQEVADKWITEGAESALAYIKAATRSASTYAKLFQQESALADRS